MNHIDLLFRVLLVGVRAYELFRRGRLSLRDARDRRLLRCVILRRLRCGCLRLLQHLRWRRLRRGQRRVLDALQLGVGARQRGERVSEYMRASVYACFCVCSCVVAPVLLITPHRHVVHLALRHLLAKKTHLNPADGGLTLFPASLYCFLVRRLLLYNFGLFSFARAPPPAKGGRGPRRGPLWQV